MKSCLMMMLFLADWSKDWVTVCSTYKFMYLHHLLWVSVSSRDNMKRETAENEGIRETHITCSVSWCLVNLFHYLHTPPSLLKWFSSESNPVIQGITWRRREIQVRHFDQNNFSRKTPNILLTYSVICQLVSLLFKFISHLFCCHHWFLAVTTHASNTHLICYSCCLQENKCFLTTVFCLL